MSKDNDSGKFWPYMILGFLAIGITLGYWTVKNTINMPVHESNEFMQKYQDADKRANDIIEAQAKFDKKYDVKFSGLQKSDFKPKFLKRKPHQYFTLNDKNSVALEIKTKDGVVVNDANVTLLLTRPQTEKDDIYFKDIKIKDGQYIVDNLEIKKPGRYILRFRVLKDNAAKYIDIYCYKDK